MDVKPCLAEPQMRLELRFFLAEGRGGGGADGGGGRGADGKELAVSVQSRASV